jgi:FlaA1/EpsC-like NDP-sugar epimerase
MKRITVFGGSGFLGNALIGRLISMGEKNIVAVGRNEGLLVALRERYPCVEIQVGDIADTWTVKKAMKDADECYLLSALKHVGLAETEVKSCVNTNIIGVTNIIGESLITKPKVLMFISTDKASQPMGIYGCTKKIGEKLMVQAEKTNPDTKYRVCRYGNVFLSTGSLATKWKPKMERGEEIILTDPEASRFFWTVQEAVSLIFECIEKAKNSTPFIPKMKAVKMSVVLDACMEVWGKSPVKVIGLQPGENKVETTDGITFSDQVEQFTKEEFINKFLYEDKLRADNKVF